MRKSEDVEEVRKKEKGRAADRINEGTHSLFSRPFRSQTLSSLLVLKEDKSGENKFGNKIIPEFIRTPD